MKKLAVLFAILGVLLSDIMCAVVSYHYRDMLCGIAHAGFSAPADTALLLAIPYGIGIVVCAVLSIVFARNAR